MNVTYVLASDLGSGACKTIIMDLRGHIVAATSQEYPTYYPQPGWVEQDPEDWYAAFCKTVRTALEQASIPPSQIAGVGIVGVTHNTVLLDEHDRPLCRTILIFDSRSTAQVQALLSRWGQVIWERTLNDITPVWTWPQLLWIRENWPEVWCSTRRILFQKDYVRHRLAPAAVTDVIDAGGTLLFDPQQEEWIEPFCADLGLPSSHLPEVVNSLDIVSVVSPQGAADSGLLAGTPVIAGTTDTVAEMLGCGSVRPGAAIVKLASVGRIAVVTREPVRSPHILNYRHILNGLWYPGTASKSAASSYRWLRDVIWPEMQKEAAYRLMDEEAATAPPGCNGLLFHPHLLGEWAPHWDDRLRGAFVGLTAQHTRAHLTRAVLEGVAFSLKDALSEMEELDVKAEDIRLIGQGAKSPLWSHIMANVLNRPLRLPEQPDAAYGAALITAMGINALERTPEAVESVVTIRQFIEPELEASLAYAALFDIYREADAALGSVSDRLHRFEQQRAGLLGR
ncbi:MAG: xylulokinase [Anaerolineae bacterium]